MDETAFLTNNKDLKFESDFLLFVLINGSGFKVTPVIISLSFTCIPIQLSLIGKKEAKLHLVNEKLQKTPKLIQVTR